MILHTIVDANDVFPYDYTRMEVTELPISHGVMQVTVFPSGRRDTRIISTDLKSYIQQNKSITEDKT